MILNLKKSGIVRRDLLLYAQCPKCHWFLCWRMNLTDLCFVATCCGKMYEADASNKGRIYFEVREKPVDMSNVRLLSVIG